MIQRNSIQLSFIIIKNKINTYKDVKIQDNMDGQMDQAGIKSRNLGEILQMYFIYVQVANRMFWLMSSSVGPVPETSVPIRFRVLQFEDRSIPVPTWLLDPDSGSVPVG